MERDLTRAGERTMQFTHDLLHEAIWLLSLLLIMFHIKINTMHRDTHVQKNKFHTHARYSYPVQCKLMFSI